MSKQRTSTPTPPRGTTMTHLTRSRTPTALVLAGAALGAVSLTACRERDEHGILVQGRGASAVLARADARQITLFGDAPDGREAEFTNRASQSMRQHTFTEVGADFDADVDATGRRLVFASTRHSTRSDLYVKDVDGVAVTQLVSDPADDVQPAWSPDDRRVAFASNRAGDWDIWITNVNGDPPVQVTAGPADDMHPSWSPDGTKLVFCSLPPGSGQWELWITDATVGGSRRFIGYGLFPEWSPTGDWIVYQRARERGSRWFSIWTLTLVGGEPRFPTELVSSAHEATVHPTWSPDGQRIAYASTAITPEETTRPARNPRAGAHRRADRAETAPLVFDIWTMGADGRGSVRLTDGHTLNYAPTFGRDGRIYFTTDRSGTENVWSVLPSAPPAAIDGDMTTSRELQDMESPTAHEVDDAQDSTQRLRAKRVSHDAFPNHGMHGPHDDPRPPTAKAAHLRQTMPAARMRKGSGASDGQHEPIPHATVVKDDLSGEPK